MKIFALSDLHLATSVDKPMNIFGIAWEDHQEKIKKAWVERITSDDIILIAGDISWGMSLEEAASDLTFLNQLPGKKVCIRGNHDYWWSKITKLNTLYETIYFLQNDAYIIGDLAICGTRGWLCPVMGQGDENVSDGSTHTLMENKLYKENKKWDIQDEKVYKREHIRLELSLKKAMTHKVKEIVVMLHYPPTNEYGDTSLFTELLKDYPVTQVVYGHLHDVYSQEKSIKGQQGSINYHLVAADYLQFIPKQIKPEHIS